jgi:hypothetical protein
MRANTPQVDSWDMTVSERIETQSFAYDAQFPPDVAAGMPLASLRRGSQSHPSAYRRALRVCARVVSRRH